MKGGEPEHFPFTNPCNILTFALKESIAWVPFFLQLVTPSDGVLGDQGSTLSLDFCQIVLCNLFMDCDSNYNKLDQCFESGLCQGHCSTYFGMTDAKYCPKWSKSLYYPINWYKIDVLLLFVVYVFYILLVYLLPWWVPECWSTKYKNRASKNLCWICLEYVFELKMG